VSRFRPLESLGRSYGVDTSSPTPRWMAHAPTCTIRRASGSIATASRSHSRRSGRHHAAHRADVAWPALVTKTVDPTADHGAVYDDHGNVTAITDSSTFQNGRYATTRYVWNGRGTSINRGSPEGDSTVTSYSSANGNRLWQQDAGAEQVASTFVLHDGEFVQLAQRGADSNQARPGDAGFGVLRHTR